MSALRIPGPDGRILLRVIDDGASPRPSGRGGGPIEYGALVVGVAKSNAQHQAAYKAREAEKARERRAAR